MKITLPVALLLGSCMYTSDGVNAITEDEDTITMRDANSSKDRPRIDGYDMDEATKDTAE